MTEIARETQRKNGEKSDKDYSIEWFGNTCIIKYKREIYNRASFKKIPFIDYLGWIAVLFAGIIYIVLGICSLGVSVFIIIHIMGINFLLIYLVILIFAFLFAILIMMGLISFGDIYYIKNTTCKKCHKKYAYEEREEPDIKEVSTEKSYKVTIIRYWKCRHCGFIDISESREILICKKTWKCLRGIEIKCEKCGKIGTYSECRRPDIKTYGTTSTIIRYYKCEGCEHINIAVEGTCGGGEYVTYESRGSDPRF